MASRPDLCARLVSIRRAHQFTAQEWQKAAVIEYASPSRPWKTPEGGGKAKDALRNRGRKLHCGATSLVVGNCIAPLMSGRMQLMGATWRQKTPIGLRYRLDVVDVDWVAPRLAVDIQVRSGVGQK